MVRPCLRRLKLVPGGVGLLPDLLPLKFFRGQGSGSGSSRLRPGCRLGKGSVRFGGGRRFGKGIFGNRFASSGLEAYNLRYHKLDIGVFPVPNLGGEMGNGLFDSGP